MSAATRTLATLGRNVASSSRQTLQRSLVSATPLAARSTYAQLRSQSTLGASSRLLPASLPLSRQLQQRRAFRTAPTLHDDRRSHTESLLPESTPSNSVSSDEETASIPVTGERTPIGQIEQRLAITFTCSVDECGHRSTHEFSKRSYTKGIVIVQCPGCKNRHLIADNLSWFTETEDEPRTIEQMIEAKGGKVRRGTVGVDGVTGETIEILS